MDRTKIGCRLDLVQGPLFAQPPSRRIFQKCTTTAIMAAAAVKPSAECVQGTRHRDKSSPGMHLNLTHSTSGTVCLLIEKHRAAPGHPARERESQDVKLVAGCRSLHPSLPCHTVSRRTAVASHCTWNIPLALAMVSGSSGCFHSPMLQLSPHPP